MASHDRKLRDNDARERLRRALPKAPTSNFGGYDNTARALMNDPSPYQEISEVLGNSRRNVDLQSEPGSDQRSRGRNPEGTLLMISFCSVGACQASSTVFLGLYSRVQRTRSNSLGTSTAGRTSPLCGYRGLGSRRSSFSNVTSSVRGRRQPSNRNNGFWCSGSSKCVANPQLCRHEFLEVNLTADSQGFGLTIAENFIGRQSILVIAEIENGGPAER